MLIKWKYSFRYSFPGRKSSVAYTPDVSCTDFRQTNVDKRSRLRIGEERNDKTQKRRKVINEKKTYDQRTEFKIINEWKNLQVNLRKKEWQRRKMKVLDCLQLFGFWVQKMYLAGSSVHVHNSRNAPWDNPEPGYVDSNVACSALKQPLDSTVRLVA